MHKKKKKNGTENLSNAPPVGMFLLGVEINGGYRQAQTQMMSESPRTKVGAYSGLIHQTKRSPLLEKDEYVSVYSHWWAWPHIWYYLFPYKITISMFKYIYIYLKHKILFLSQFLRFTIIRRFEYSQATTDVSFLPFS